MKELVEKMVKGLVDEPEEVLVNETSGESIIVIEVNVASNDIGKVIGKEGRIANAIRTVARAAGAKINKKVQVEIITPQTKYPGRQ